MSNLDKLHYPERIKKQIQKELQPKPTLYSLAIEQKKGFEAEKVKFEEERRFLTNITLALISKSHHEVIQWFAEFLENEVLMGKSKPDTSIVTPETANFLESLKTSKAIPSLLEFLGFIPCDKFNTWKIPGDFTTDALTAKAKYLRKLVGFDLHLEDVQMEHVAKDPSLAKVIFKSTVDYNTCKSCKREFSNLKLHLSKTPKCNEMYLESEIGYLLHLSESKAKRKAKERYEKNKDKLAAKYQENKEAIAKRHLENREENLKKMAKYYDKNREDILIKRSEHYAENREKISEIRAKSYASKKTGKSIE